MKQYLTSFMQGDLFSKRIPADMHELSYYFNSLLNKKFSQLKYLSWMVLCLLYLYYFPLLIFFILTDNMSNSGFNDS